MKTFLTILTLATLLVFVSAPLLTLAADPPITGGNPSVIDSPEEVVGAITRIGGFIFSIFLVIAVIMIVIAAFHALAAQGNAEKFGEARRMIVYAAIAVAVAVLSKGIVEVVKRVITASAH